MNTNIAIEAPSFANEAKAQVVPVGGTGRSQPPVVLRSPRTRLHSFEFSTADLPDEEQFQAWRASYSAILDFVRPSDATGGFVGRHQAWDLGNLVFTRVRTDGLDFAGLAGHSRRDPLDHWLVTLPLEGQSVTIADGRQLVCGAGSVQLHALGQAFEGSVSGSELLMLFVPRDLCRDNAHVLDSIAFSRLEGGMGRIFADYMVSLARRLPLMDASELPTLVAATRAMLLACAEPTSGRLEEAESSISSLLLERARSYIHANLHDHELGSRALLRELGISRSRLYRLFEASDGVMRYIQRRRLAAAHAELADANNGKRILEIAESYCFGDGAEFSRAFRREFGYSPTDVRTGMRRGLPGRHCGDVEGGASQRLNVLLRRLQG